MLIKSEWKLKKKKKRIKNDWRSNLGRDRLESLLWISEEGPSSEYFNPDSAIGTWYVDKKWWLNTVPHNYLLKQVKISNGNDVIDMATLTLSDLEENESDVEVDSQFWMIYFRSFIPKFLLCSDNFYFILLTVCCYVFRFYCDLYNLMLYFSRNSNLDKFYDYGKILFYTYMFLIKIHL